MKLFCSILLLLCGLGIQAQKVDLDKFVFTATYQEFPNTWIDSSYHTFSISTSGSTGLNNPAKENELFSQVAINGWRKLPSNAHVHVQTWFEPVVMRNWEIKERVQLSKGKTDKDTIRTTYYRIEITYSFGAKSEMKDYKGNIIWSDQLVSPEQKQVYKTQEFSNFLEASFYFKYQSSTEMERMNLAAVQNAVNQLNNILNYNFGYNTRTVNDIMWVLDSKRHPEYEAHRKAWLLTRQAFFEMDASKPVDEVRRSLEAAIAYFDKIPRMYNSNSKGDKKMRYASYYNLAKIYYYLDEPEAAMNEAGKLIMNGYDSKDGKMLEQWALNLKALFTQQKRNSRHFPITPELYTGPQIAPPPAQVVPVSKVTATTKKAK